MLLRLPEGHVSSPGYIPRSGEGEAAPHPSLCLFPVTNTQLDYAIKQTNRSIQTDSSQVKPLYVAGKRGAGRRGSQAPEMQ